MSNVIILNLSGALQSWAGYSVVKTRVDTDRKPSKNAILGLISSAHGVSRGDELPEDLKNVEIKIETLHKGRIVRDYHTTSTQDADRAGAKPHDQDFYDKVGRIIARGKKTPDKIIQIQQVIARTYLADATFIVTIKGADEESTERIFEKLKNPVWAPYLGKKAFSPTFPFILGLHDENSAMDFAKEVLEEINKELKTYV